MLPPPAALCERADSGTHGTHGKSDPFLPCDMLRTRSGCERDGRSPMLAHVLEQLEVESTANERFGRRRLVI